MEVQEIGTVQCQWLSPRSARQVSGASAANEPQAALLVAACSCRACWGCGRGIFVCEVRVAVRPVQVCAKPSRSAPRGGTNKRTWRTACVDRFLWILLQQTPSQLFRLAESAGGASPRGTLPPGAEVSKPMICSSILQACCLQQPGILGRFASCSPQRRRKS